MTAMEEFTSRLTTLCNQYGIILSGKTTTGAIHAHTVEGEVECSTQTGNGEMTFIYCKKIV